MAIALQSGGVVYSQSGGTLHVTTSSYTHVDLFPHEPSEAAGSLVEADVSLPDDARIHRALFDLTARATGATTVSSVAQVRGATAVTATSTACTVDFGRLVTVGGLQTPIFSAIGIDKVFFWTGTSWSGGRSGVSFPETLTERLLLETTDDVDDNELAAFVHDNVDALLPVAPSGLELQVDGVTVWFERQGSTPGEDLPTVVAGGSAYVVDRTDALRDAFDRASASGGVRTVRVAMRAAAPGALSLTPRPYVLRVHTVQFPPEGLTRTVDVAEEGAQQFDVTPPPTAVEVRSVELVVRGGFGADRVQPAVGPAIEPDARLALAPDRTLLVGLPALLVLRYGALTGVRLLLTATTGGGGVLAGRLLADAEGRPGDPLKNASFTPFTVASGLAGWSTLSLTEPLPANALTIASPTGVAAWLELQLSDGEVECALTQAARDNAEAPGGPLLRRLPGGGSAALSTIEGLSPLNLALRLVGRPGPSGSLPAVSFSVLGGQVGGSGSQVGVDPSADDISIAIPLDPPLTVGGTTLLSALVFAAGSLTLDTVQVLYAEGGAE